jgi:hypothetical protein
VDVSDIADVSDIHAAFSSESNCTRWADGDCRFLRNAGEHRPYASGVTTKNGINNIEYNVPYVW